MLGEESIDLFGLNIGEAKTVLQSCFPVSHSHVAPIRHTEVAFVPAGTNGLGCPLHYITFDPFSQMTSKHSDAEMLTQKKATAAQ